MADKIIQTIELVGTEKIEAQLRGVGQTGDQAFRKLGESAQFTEGQLGAIAAMAKRTGTSVEAMTAKVAAASATFQKLGASTAQAAAAQQAMAASGKAAQAAAAGTSTWAQALASVGTALGNTRSKVKPLTEAISALSNSNDQATGRVGGFSELLIKVGQNLRLVSRAAKVPELGIFARGLGVVGRAAALAVPVIGAVGLERLTSHAAKAADEFANVAASLKLPIEQFGELRSIGTALGLSVEDTGKSFDGVGKLIKETAENTTRNTETFRQFDRQIAASADNAVELQRGFSQIGSASTGLSRQLAQGKISSSDFAAGQAELAEKARQLNRQLRLQNEQTAELELAQRRAKVAAAESATVLDKLGIAVKAVGASQLPEVLSRIADALKNTTDLSQRQKIEFELIAAGVSRDMLPALRLGAEGFKALAAEGAKIRPPFTEQQISLLDQFRIAQGQLLQSLGAIVDKLGLLGAPIVTETIQSLTKFFVDNRDAIVGFAQAVGNVLLPVLQGLGTFFSSILIPFFGFLQAIFVALVAKFNEFFSTSITPLQALGVIIAGAIILFGGWLNVILIVFAAIGALVAQLQRLGVLDQIKTGLTNLWAFMVAGFTAVLTFITKVFDGTFILQFVEFCKTKFTELWTFITDGFATALAWVFGLFDPVIAKIQKAIDLVRTLLGLTGGSTTGADQGPELPGRASGGLITGKGTGTSDSILARLSNKEFVMRAAAVRKFGVGFMSAINAGRMPKFNTGGLVDMSALASPRRFAAGGQALSESSSNQLRPFSLTVDGESFGGLLAPDDVASKMMQFALGRQVRRAGKRPGWVK